MAVTVNSVGISGRVGLSTLLAIPVNLPDAGTAEIADTGGAYAFTLATDGTATVTVGAATITVADTDGEFIWDQGGPGEHTFTTIGETITRTIDGDDYTITWNGIGSQRFTVKKKAAAAPPPPPVNAPPQWTTNSGSLGTILEGATANFSVAATDPTNQSLTYSILDGALPLGLSLDGSSGAITGPVGAVGSNTSYSFTLGVSDGTNMVEREFAITVLNNQGPAFTTPGGDLGDFTESEPVSNVQIVATDAEGNTPVTFALANGTAVPAGLTLNADGTITGTPSDVASNTTSTFMVRATDSLGNTSDREFSMTVVHVDLGAPRMMTVGSNNTGNVAQISTSPNGTAWTRKQMTTGEAGSGNSVTMPFRGVATNGSRFVMVASRDTTITSTVMRYTDDGGATFGTPTGPTTTISTFRGLSIAYNTRFCAVGKGGLVRLSADGGTWTAPANLGSIDLVSVVAWSIGFLAFTNNGTIYRTTNSGNDLWEAVPTTGVGTNSNGWTSMATNNLNGTAQRTILVGNGGAVRLFVGSMATSGTKGFTTPTTSYGAGNLNSIAYGNGFFAAVGASGLLTYTADSGGTWATAGHLSGNLTAIAFIDGAWYAAGPGTLYRSTDLTAASGTWQDLSGTAGVTHPQNIYAIAGHA